MTVNVGQFFSPSVITETTTVGGNLGASATIDFGSQTNKRVQFTGTLTANCTITLANRQAGCRATLLLAQDGTGGRTLSISDGITPTAIVIPSAISATFEIVVECTNTTDVYVMPTSSGPLTNIDGGTP